jgi:lantibiotic modifying enzyme
MAASRWQPLLDGDRAEQARTIAFEIVCTLEHREPSRLHGLKGEVSTALLLAHCERSTAVARLEFALNIVVTQPATIALFGGIAGSSWILNHLVQQDEAEPVLAQFDTGLLRYLNTPRWKDRLDLVSGLAGIGVSVANRRDGRALQIADCVLSHLEAAAITDDAGTTWRTPARFLSEERRVQFPEGMIDLGVAHGVSGIIGMLTQFVAADLQATRSSRLLESAIEWLLDTVPNDEPRFGKDWPASAGRNKPIGWCYGDAGVAGVLLHASSVLNSPRLEAEALGLLQSSAALLGPRGVDDAGFCHGAAGLAHIYNVAFQRTGNVRMRLEAEHWIMDLLRRRTPGIRDDRYASSQYDSGVRYLDEDPKLISGSVGIALVLLAATENREPEWQRLFVL